MPCCLLLKSFPNKPSSYFQASSCLTHWVKFESLIQAWVGWCLLDCGQLISDYTTGKNDSPPSNHQLSIDPQGGGETSWDLLASVIQCQQAEFGADKHSCSEFMSTRAMSCLPLSWWSLSHGWYDIDVSFRAKHSTITYSQHCDSYGCLH